MKQMTRGIYAESLAGHDKGKSYIVTDFDAEYVFLADGEIRSVDRPKRKKKKHVQLTYRIEESLQQAVESEAAFTNEEIRKALKARRKLDV